MANRDSYSNAAEVIPYFSDSSDDDLDDHDSYQEIDSSPAVWPTKNGNKEKLEILKPIEMGSRKDMRVKPFVEAKHLKSNDKILTICNSGSNDINGIYFTNGFRNGYVTFAKMTDMIDTNSKCMIYCNPKRGWTITKNNAVHYYSYPVSKLPPINDDKYEWHTQIGKYPLPSINYAQISDKYNCFDLLFVGFFRQNENKEDNNDNIIRWNLISTDIVHLFCNFFWSSNNRCQHCLRQCQNVVLYGYRWLCDDCC